jgi:hypothetical protein
VRKEIAAVLDEGRMALKTISVVERNNCDRMRDRMARDMHSLNSTGQTSRDVPRCELRPRSPAYSRSRDGERVGQSDCLGKIKGPLDCPRSDLQWVNFSRLL